MRLIGEAKKNIQNEALSTKLLRYYALILLERAGEMHHDDSLKERRKACGSVQFTQVRLDANEFMT